VAWLAFAKQIEKANAYTFCVLADRGYGKIKDRHELTAGREAPLLVTIRPVKYELKYP
jgi:hypothetical protein